MSGFFPRQRQIRARWPARRRRSVEIQAALWRHADAAAAEAPDDITALFVDAVKRHRRHSCRNYA